MATRLEQAESAVVVPVELPVAVRRLRDRMDPLAAAGVPAHVTLLYPFLDPEQLDDSARQTLERIVGAEPGFAFALARTGRWPDVVYLAPEPDEPFRRLIGALSESFPEHPPYGGAHRDVVPHVTIAQGPRSDYLAAAEHALPASLPIRAVAREVWLIAHAGQQPWAVHWRMPLGAAVR
jgi:2'-5' RNA ligase